MKKNYKRIDPTTIQPVFKPLSPSEWMEKWRVKMQQALQMAR